MRNVTPIGGLLGVKSGEGFYTYPGPAFLQENFLT